MFVRAGQINSRDVEVEYNFDGYPEKYTLYFSLDLGLGAQKYLMIEWPFDMGATSQISAELTEYDTGQVLGQGLTPTSSSTQRQTIFRVPQALSKGLWYLLEISVPIVAQTPGFYSAPVQFYTQSSDDATRIIYDFSRAFSNLYIAAPPTAGTLQANASVLASFGSVKNSASAQYLVNLDLAAAISQPNGAVFILRIEKQDGQYGSTNKADFYFTGVCSSVSESTLSITAVLSSCTISSDLSEIRFEYKGDLQAGKVFRLQFQVQNPIYISQRSLRIFYHSNNNKRVQENAVLTGFFSVSPISLLTGSVAYFWGLSTTPELIPSTVLHQRVGGVGGPLNPLRISFRVATPVPVGAQFELLMDVDATTVLEDSIFTNLPQFYDTKLATCVFLTDDKKIWCRDIGAFIYDSQHEYFVSFRAYFGEEYASKTSLQLGAVHLKSVALNVLGESVEDVSLFIDSANFTVPLAENEELLDSQPGGWHDSSSASRQFLMGTTQIVSYADDGSLGALSKAVENLLTGASSQSVGVFPQNRLKEDQQLLFFLRADVSRIFGATTSGKYARTSILYNANAVRLDSGVESRGLDLVAYNNVTKSWDTQSFPCISSASCTWYDSQLNQQRNLITYPTQDVTGLVQFDCGALAQTTDLATACNNLLGNPSSSATGTSGVLSLRHVSYPLGFQSSPYSDDLLLDFLITFSTTDYEAGKDLPSSNDFTVQRSSLINAYTLIEARLSNLKASFVNYLDAGNAGDKIPTLLRIAGTVETQEHLGALKIRVFFDSNLDASHFLFDDSDPFNRSLGCSQGECLLQRRAEGFRGLSDVWFSNTNIEVLNIPILNNEFNILIPISNEAGIYPKNLVLGFYDFSNQPFGQGGYEKPLSVYRVFGSPILSQVYLGTGYTLTYINDLISNNNNAIDFSAAQNIAGGGSFNYQLDSSKISPLRQRQILVNNLLSSSVTGSGRGKYGAGITICSKYFNLFETLIDAYLVGYPQQKCESFSYQVSSVTNYVVFCAIDSALSLNNSNSDIVLNAPLFPLYFVRDFPIERILSLAISNSDGKLIGFRPQSGSLPSSSGINQCTLSRTYPQLYVNTLGYQLINIELDLGQLLQLDPLMQQGFAQLLVRLTLSQAVTGLNFAQSCRIASLESALTCSMLALDSSSIQFTLTAGELLELSSLTIQQRVQGGAISSSLREIPFSVIVQGAIDTSSNLKIFGDFVNNAPNALTLFSCSGGVLDLNRVALTSNIELNSLDFQFWEQRARGYFSFIFKLGQREFFLSDSGRLEIDFGFLQSPNLAQKEQNDLSCQILDATTNEVSWLWRGLDFSSLSKVLLTAAEDFANPDQYLFKLRCQGGQTPDGLNLQPLVIDWLDSNTQIQHTQTTLAYPTSKIITTPKNLTTAITLLKQFRTQGFDSLYSFTIRLPLAASAQSRIYVLFPRRYLPGLNRRKTFECYLRTGTTASEQAFCENSQDHQLLVSVNRVLPANTDFVLEIYGVTQVRATDITTQQIFVAVDLDSNNLNGLSYLRYVDDLTPNSNSIAQLRLVSVEFQSTPVETQSENNLTLQAELPPGFVTTGQQFFLEFPNHFATNLVRAQSFTCSVQRAGVAYNSGNCSMLSRRRLTFSFSQSDASPTTQTYFISVVNLSLPDLLPASTLFNSFVFNILKTDTTMTQVTHFSSLYDAPRTSLVLNTDSYQFSWKIYQIDRDDEGNVIQRELEEFVVYKGYYRIVLRLESETDFMADFEFGLASTDKFSIKGSRAKALSGARFAEFQVAARGNTTEGIYLMKFSGDLVIPSVQVRVQQTACRIEAQKQIYYVPLSGGKSLPIVFDFSLCSPANDLSLSPVLTGTGTQNLLWSSQLNISRLNSSSSLDSRVIIVLQHNTLQTNLSSGFTEDIAFTLNGTDSLFYAAPSSISVVYQNPLSGNLLRAPEGAVPRLLARGSNFATLNLSCSQPAILFWTLGLYPSLFSVGVADIRAKVLTENGALERYNQPNDFSNFQVFGFQSSEFVYPLTLNFTELKSNSSYHIKFYCLNQMDLLSSETYYNWSTTDNGAFLLKITISYDRFLRIGQINQVVCKIGEYLDLPASRIYSELGTVCNDDRIGQEGYNLSATREVRKQRISGNVPYMFYLVPEYQASIDLSNLMHRERVNEIGFGAYLTTLFGFPARQIDTEEVDQSVSGVLIDIGYLQVFVQEIQLSAVIRNRNGYIALGLIEGKYDDPPSLLYLLNKKFDEGTSLLAVQHQFAVSDEAQYFTFSGLQRNQVYTLFIVGTTDDPSIMAAQVTNSKAYQIQTLSEEQIYTYVSSLLLHPTTLSLICLLLFAA